MARPTIDYLNARRAAKAAAGGTNYRARECAHYAPDAPDPFELALRGAQSALFQFAIWAEQSRAQYLAAAGMTPAADPETEIPF